MPKNISAIILSSSILAFALWVGWTSWSADSSAYLFPRLITAVFVVLASLLLARTLWQGETLPHLNLKKLAPALLILTFYAFIGAKLIGFYLSSSIIFVTLLTIYDNKGISNPQTWLKRIMVAGACIAVMYALFSLLLRVQTPTGWLI